MARPVQLGINFQKLQAFSTVRPTLYLACTTAQTLALGRVPVSCLVGIRSQKDLMCAQLRHFQATILQHEDWCHSSGNWCQLPWCCWDAMSIWSRILGNCMKSGQGQSCQICLSPGYVSGSCNTKIQTSA